MSDMADQVPLHPLALRCLEAVAPGDADKSLIPHEKLAALENELRALVHDQTLFEHLCVVAYRLYTGGLVSAGKQIVELARIGMDAAQVEETMASADAMKKKADQLAASASALNKGSQLAGGLAPKVAPKLGMKIGPKR